VLFGEAIFTSIFTSKTAVLEICLVRRGDERISNPKSAQTLFFVPFYGGHCWLKKAAVSCNYVLYYLSSLPRPSYTSLVPLYRHGLQGSEAAPGLVNA
jgi:hypothetical protein